MRMRSAARDSWAALALVVALLLAWEGAVRGAGVNAFLLPPPTAIGAALADGLVRGSLLPHLYVTAKEALLGFAIAALAGFLIGAIAAQSRLFERTLYRYLVAIQTMPKVALAPLFVAWFGFGMVSKVGVAALVSFFPVLLSVVVGLKSCDAGKLDLMRSLSASEWQVFRYVRLPNALPFVFSGLSVASVFAVTGAIVGEFVGAREGLGYEMLVANGAMNVSRSFAILVLLGALGYAMHAAVEFAARRALYWQPERSIRSYESS
jgi:NitT/TauT family transport system permease protein